MSDNDGCPGLLGGGSICGSQYFQTQKERGVQCKDFLVEENRSYSRVLAYIYLAQTG